ncbi:hypothetical protein [Streptomyces sp. WMMC905]|uniref:hypothetical protein n=1 Tax=Streptomyces sp. WMMC905 TaxID=3404123 RepID=UPI003B933712
MAQTLRSATGGGLLATDGKPHPLQRALLAITGILGIIAFVTSFFAGLHLVGSWTGLVGLLVGAYGQWTSQTTRQRFGFVMGMGSSGFGLLLSMANGGLFGGVIG